jgi:hypothetical protein
MFKQIAAALLLLCCMAQTFSQAAMVGSYYINTAAYAKDCINKAKPKLHCNGKCQLMKKMKQEENKDKQNPERRNSSDEVLSSKSFFTSVQIIPVIKPTHFSSYISSFPTERSTEFFHPPGA